MDREQIQQELQQRADAGYRSFSSGLLPGTKGILGVRLPDLRALAKRLSCEDDWRETLRELSDDIFEERMLQGFVSEQLEHIRWFVRKIDSWSLCDSFYTSLNFLTSSHDCSRGRTSMSICGTVEPMEQHVPLPARWRRAER